MSRCPENVWKIAIFQMPRRFEFPENFRKCLGGLKSDGNFPSFSGHFSMTISGHSFFIGEFVRLEENSRGVEYRSRIKQLERNFPKVRCLYQQT
jgi:hypothetical protein